MSRRHLYRTVSRGGAILGAILMKTYRVFLTGAADGVLYAMKEYTASDRSEALTLADEICAASWGDQRLVKVVLEDQEARHSAATLVHKQGA